jgi:hypothetical protein
MEQTPTTIHAWLAAARQRVEEQRQAEAEALAAVPRSVYFQQQLAEEPVKEKVSTALPPIAGLSFLPDVAKHSHQVNPGGVVRFGSADLL